MRGSFGPRMQWLSLLLVLGCAHREAVRSTGEGGSPEAARYYPLAVGREWTYQARFLGERRVLTVRILKQEGGYFVDSQGGMLKVDSAGVRDRQRYLLQTPLDVGRTWVNVLSANSAEHYRIESVGSPCEAPAGRFEDCAVVESSTLLPKAEGSLLNRLTFGAGVGLVRSEVYLLRGGRRSLQSELLLQSY
jgi:hypothetical protein